VAFLAGFAGAFGKLGALGPGKQVPRRAVARLGMTTVWEAYFCGAAEAAPFQSVVLSNHRHLSNLQNLVKGLEGGFWDQVVDSVGEIVRAIMSLSDYAV
jgi:hypothetical protein